MLEISVEISCSIVVEAAIDKSTGVEQVTAFILKQRFKFCSHLYEHVLNVSHFFVGQYVITHFADALHVVPIALAENSDLSPIETLSAVKAKVTP